MKAEGTVTMLEKFLLATLVLGFLFAFGMTRALEMGQSETMKAPFVSAPSSATVSFGR